MNRDNWFVNLMLFLIAIFCILILWRLDIIREPLIFNKFHFEKLRKPIRLKKLDKRLIETFQR